MSSTNTAEDLTLKNVLSWFDKNAPTCLADSWDNVGLIAQSPVPKEDDKARGLFLAIDLTPAVAEELLAKPDVRVAIVYHPVIFSPIRSITMQNPLQRSILRCIAAGIHIYCPHTTLDACLGGINDWLVTGLEHAWESSHVPKPESLLRAVRNASYEIIEPSKDDPSVGMGRAHTFAQPCSWAALIHRVKALLRVSHVQIAPASGVNETTQIRSIAVCAGSGGSVLRGWTDADVYVTGEMGHHDILAANARGISVILTNHTNTERRYLVDVLQPALSSSLPGSHVYVSERDADPLCVA